MRQPRPGLFTLAAILTLAAVLPTAFRAADLSEKDRQGAEDLIWQTVRQYNEYKGYRAKVVGVSPLMGNAPGVGEFHAVAKLGWRAAKLEITIGADVMSRETLRSGLFVYAFNVNPGGAREVHRFYQEGYSSTFFVPDPIERLQELNRRYLFTAFADQQIEIDGKPVQCKRIAGTLRANAYDTEIRNAPEQEPYFKQLAAMSATMVIDMEVGKAVRQVQVLTADGKVALSYTFSDLKTDEIFKREDFEYKPPKGEAIIEHEAPTTDSPEIKERVNTAVDLKAAGQDDAKAREIIENAKKSLDAVGGFTAQIRLVMPAVLQPQSGDVSGIPGKSLERIDIARMLLEGAKGGNAIVNNGQTIGMKMQLPTGQTIDNSVVYMRPVGPILHNMQSPPQMLPMADLTELKSSEEGEMLEIAENKMVRVVMVEGRFDAEIAIKRLGLDQIQTDGAKQIVEQLRDAAKETPRVRFFLRADDFFPVRYERLAPDGKPIYISDLYSVKVKQNLNATLFK